jgi:hypothetical protein
MRLGQKQVEELIEALVSKHIPKIFQMSPSMSETHRPSELLMGIKAALREALTTWHGEGQ